MKVKNGITEMVFIIDRSGSMRGLEDDTIGGFNEMIEKQKQLEGTCLVSTVFFSNDSKVIHDRLDIKEVKPLTRKDYSPCGCTALLDAIGRAIHHIGNIHKYSKKEDVPEHTIFVITTDGMENSSYQYSSDEIKSMISRQEEKYDWEFVFVAANIDAIEVAGNIGIRKERAANYNYSKKGTVELYAAVETFIHEVRCNNVPGEKWKEKITKEKKC